jgi:hypothetical protein
MAAIDLVTPELGDGQCHGGSLWVKNRYCYGKDSVFTDEERAPRNGRGGAVR